MEFMLSVALIFFMGIGFVLVKLLLEEVDRQRNPHLYSSKSSIAKQQAEIRNHYQNTYKTSFTQFEKPHTARNVSPAKPQVTNIKSTQNSQPAKQEPQTFVNHQTQEHLYTLVHGDMKVVRRLIDGVKERNPERSNQWVWEKVIYDLERDRRI